MCSSMGFKKPFENRFKNSLKLLNTKSKQNKGIKFKSWISVCKPPQSVYQCHVLHNRLKIHVSIEAPLHFFGYNSLESENRCICVIPNMV